MSVLAINGGTRVRSEPYPAWPQVDQRDADAVADVVLNGQIGGWPEPGPRNAEFAARFADYQGAAHGIVMVNGTVTMEVALKALGIGWGDEVIVPALTFAATAYAAIAAGALPVIVDVRTGALDDRPRCRRGRDHAAHARHHAGAPGPADGRHGPPDGDRRPARAGDRRGLRARARPAVGRPRGRLHRRVRLVQPPVLEDR